DASDITARFVAHVTGVYVLDTDDPATTLDTVLYVLDGCGGAELACNDAMSVTESGPSRVTLPLDAGQEIVIVVDGFFGRAGAAVLHVDLLSLAPSECAAPAVTWAEATAADQPLHHFGFDESPGSTFLDEVSGVEAVGSVDAGQPGAATTGFPGFAHGNRAAAFEGASGQPVAVADHRSLDIRGPLTLEAMVYLERAPTAAADLIAKSADGQRSYALFVDGTGTLGLAVSADGSAETVVQANRPLPLRQWVHVAGVFEPGVRLAVYEGAERVGERGSDVPGALHRGTAPLHLGAHLEGSLDEVVVYDRALSPESLALHVAAATQCGEDLPAMVLGEAPVAYWRFDEASGTRVAEARGKSVLDGTAGTGVQLGSGGPQPGFVGAPVDNRSVALRDDALTVLDPAPASGALTLEALVFLDAHPVAETVLVARDLGQGDPSGVSLVLDPELGRSRLGLVVARPGVAPGLRLLDLGPFPRHRWVHVAGVWEPGRSAELFVDGVLTVAQTFGVPERGQSGTGPVFIGADPTLANPVNALPGRIDEVLLYDTALPAARIEAHASALKNGTAP
ncbi:MAG: LamG domain-containing protein, partial [Myxococcota bacterium]